MNERIHSELLTHYIIQCFHSFIHKLLEVLLFYNLTSQSTHNIEMHSNWRDGTRWRIGSKSN